MSRRATVEEASEFLGSLCPTVIIKRGSRGALLKDKKGVRHSAGIPVQVQDTIGAGDNLAAAYLYATLTAKMEPSLALDFANAAAARSCLFPGGTEAASTHTDVRAFQEAHA